VYRPDADHEEHGRPRDEREEEGRRRAVQERLRIARELHDTLAHSLVAMNVRASVAVDLDGAQDPSGALRDIKQVSATALRDLRATLSLLREQDDAAPTAPAFDLEALPGLVDHARSGLQRHPLIMCEFSHAMGNSNGTLAEYWDAIESTPGLQGGFIWEFWDHGLVQQLPDGSYLTRVYRSQTDRRAKRLLRTVGERELYFIAHQQREMEEASRARLAGVSAGKGAQREYFLIASAQSDAAAALLVAFISDNGKAQLCVVIYAFREILHAQSHPA